MAYTIEEIEDAIISALGALNEGDGALGIRTIKSYQGELESEDDIKKIARLFPAIYVVYGGSEYKAHGGRKVEEVRFFLFFCDKNLRSEDQARRGSTENPGTYAMMDSARDELYGQTFSLDIFPVKLLSQEAVWFGNGISIYAAEYETAQAHLYPAA